MVNLLARACVRNFHDPSGSAPVGIFSRDRFLPLSFGLIMVSVRVLANSPTLPEAHWLQFLRATASNIRHFVQLGYLCDFA